MSQKESTINHNLSGDADRNGSAPLAFWTDTTHDDTFADDDHQSAATS